MENSVDRRERTVFVTDMHKTVTEEVLYDLFKQCGPIEKVILKEDPEGVPQHALIIFKNVQSVMHSIAALNGTTFGDVPLSLRPLRESSHTAALASAELEMLDSDRVTRYNTRSSHQQQQQHHSQGPLGASFFSGAMSHPTGLLPQSYRAPFGYQGNAFPSQWNQVWGSGSRYSMPGYPGGYYK